METSLGRSISLGLENFDTGPQILRFDLRRGDLQRTDPRRLWRDGIQGPVAGIGDCRKRGDANSGTVARRKSRRRGQYTNAPVGSLAQEPGTLIFTIESN